MRNWSLFIVWGSVLILAGCGGGTTANLQNPPAPASAAVSISFSPTPPSSISLVTNAPITAVVNNDPSKSGVDWSLVCPNAAVNCGSLSVLHTASGQPTTYMPPASMSTNTQSATIFAFATADHTKNISTSITVSAFAGFLKSGTYILETNGFDIAGFPYERAAAVMLNGAGGITGGEQTVDFLNLTTQVYSSVNDVITGGSYFIGPDGRGTLTINTNDLNIGQLGIQTFSLVALSSTQALVTKTDVFTNPNAPLSNESCVGTMQLQTSSAPVSQGGYAFTTRGGSDPGGSPMAFGGVLNVDGPQSISGNGSKFDEVLLASPPVTPSLSISGTLSSPDKFGRFEFNLTVNFFTPPEPEVVTFTAYIVDGSHLKLIETDGSVAMTGGIAIGQGALTGTFSAFSGNYTFGLFGQDLSGEPSSLAAAGSFTAGAGSLTNGFIDELQSGLMVQVSDGFSATYTVDPSGRVDTYNYSTFSPSFTFATAANGTGPDLVFYLTNNTDPVLVLDSDVEPLLNQGSGGGGIATGPAYLTTAGATFAGDYGLSFTQNFTGDEADGTGQVCANWSSVKCPGGTADTFSGTADQSIDFSPETPATLAGVYQGSAISGRLTGTLSDVNFFVSPVSVAFYLIDSTQGFLVETDGGANGTNPGNLSFGYFVVRTPVCNGCP